MQPISDSHDWPVLNATEVRALEWAHARHHGLPLITLMERAATALDELLLLRYPRLGQATILCGPGNNGGDGYALAPRLKARGVDVRVCALAAPATDDARAMAAAWQAKGGRVADDLSGLDDPVELIVDALYGAGLSRPLDGAAADWVAAINALRAPVCAVDLPSGMAADSTMAKGPMVAADLTLALIAPKPALVSGPTLDATGALYLAALGCERELATWPCVARVIANAALGQRAPRRPSSHKGNHGHVLVVGGDYGMAGAPLMSASAALRAGCGLATVHTRSEHRGGLLAARPELMTSHDSEDLRRRLSDPRITTLIVGPGLGREAWGRDAARAVLRTTRPVVVDADALRLLEPGDQPGPRILTPHPGEAGLLLASSAATVEANRFAAARALADRYQSVVVLKGAGTIVADVTGDLRVLPLALPQLATGGTGDALAGVIGGLWAQGAPAHEAATLAVVSHARAAQLASGGRDFGMRVTELIDAIPEALQASSQPAQPL